MKVLYNNRHIKTVQKKYRPILGMIPDLILFEDRKRPSVGETGHLENALLRRCYINFVKGIEKDQPFVFAVIKGANPHKLTKVTRRDGTVEFNVMLCNGMRVKCERSQFPGVLSKKGFEW